MPPSATLQVPRISAFQVSRISPPLSRRPRAGPHCRPEFPQVSRRAPRRAPEGGRHRPAPTAPMRPTVRSGGTIRAESHRCTRAEPARCACAASTPDRIDFLPTVFAPGPVETGKGGEGGARPAPLCHLHRRRPGRPRKLSQYGGASIGTSSVEPFTPSNCSSLAGAFPLTHPSQCRQLRNLLNPRSRLLRLPLGYLNVSVARFRV